MHPHQELAQFFFKQIHRYYPIGLPHFASVYAGFEEIQEIQKKKFEAIENERPKEWYQLAQVIREEWSGYEVFNSVAAQFPCYEVIVTLTSESKTGLHIHCSLVLSISLLVKYYAIVLIDEYSYRGPKHSGVAHKVVCSGLQHHSEIDSRIEDLKNLVENYFPDYKYVPHNVLFNYKIVGGFPYKGTYEDLGEYTIYDYLFSGSLFRQKYTVAH